MATKNRERSFSPSKINSARTQLQKERNRTKNTGAGSSFLSQRKSAIDRWK